MTRLELPSSGHIGLDHFQVAVHGEYEHDGKWVELYAKDRRLGRFALVDRWDGPLAHVPAMMLETSYEPLARTFSGLCAYLRATAGPGEKVIGFETIVTVLTLKRAPEAEDPPIRIASEVDLRRVNGSGR